jgi:hypothetical protein
MEVVSDRVQQKINIYQKTAKRKMTGIGDDSSVHLKWQRTHFMLDSEKRNQDDRREANCFIAQDRRSGIACRRKEKQLEMERRIALSRVTFYPEYFKIS